VGSAPPDSALAICSCVAYSTVASTASVVRRPSALAARQVDVLVLGQAAEAAEVEGAIGAAPLVAEAEIEDRGGAGAGRRPRRADLVGAGAAVVVVAAERVGGEDQRLVRPVRVGGRMPAEQAAERALGRPVDDLAAAAASDSTAASGSTMRRGDNA
jgi:hypothetical protein